jgi:hypothetical protein
VIPKFIGDLPIPPELSVFMGSAKSDLAKAGVKSDKYYFGGHSLGGSSVASYAHSNINSVKGVFVMGAYAANTIKDPA